VHQLVNKYNFDNMKMHGKNVTVKNITVQPSFSFVIWIIPELKSIFNASIYLRLLSILYVPFYLFCGTSFIVLFLFRPEMYQTGEWICCIASH
jgi:hypothetical protein